MQRSFLAEVKQITSYFIWAIIGIGALLIIAMMVLLDRLVLSPLKRLSSKVLLLDFTTYDGQLDEPDGVELSNLARTINNAIKTSTQLKNDAERANETKSRFLATMTHELRTPLTAILGQAELLQEGIWGPLNDQQSLAVTSIGTSGQQLISLISDILDSAKIEAGKMEIFRQCIIVDDLCRSCIAILAAPAAAKGIDLSYLNEDAPKVCHADLLRMNQILLNLLSNAVKFTLHGGTVVLKVSGDPDRREVHFSVRDTGIGISEEQQQKLFQPFTQVDDSLSRRHEGTGLGLSLVAQLTALHHGTVTVESRLGAGSTFTVTIPWEEEIDELTVPLAGELDESGTPASPALLRGSDAHPPLILLAEDNQVAFDTVAAYLRGVGYRVIEARTGEEAVVLAESERPALILMDIHMPGIDGLEAIQRIRKLPGPTGSTPIIALTALTLSEDRERCLKAGADKYVGKPVRLKELCRHIELLLTERTPIT